MVRCFLYVLFLVCCLQVHPQLLPFKTYSVQDGLISKDITATIRDDKGLLWVGTPFGVNWFDGKNFHTPQLELKTGQLYVTNFYKDSQGTVWVLTFYNGLYRFKNNRFTNYLPAALESNSNSIFDMVEMEKGRYLLATDQNIFWFDGNTFRLFDSSRADLKIQFTTVACIDRENILFGNEHGLIWNRYENNRWRSTRFLQNYAIHDLLRDANDLWISTNKGLLLYKLPLTFPAPPAQTYFPNQHTGNISKEGNAGIWLPVSGNVYNVDNDKISFYTEANGLPPNIKSIYCDNEGIKWIATGEGLTKLYKTTYQYENLEKSGINGLITRLEKDRDGNLWIGTYEGLAKKTAEGYKIYTHVNDTKIGYVSWLHQGKKGLYAGTNAGIIEIKDEKLVQKNSLLTSAMCEDESGDIWLGTVAGKIFRYGNEKLDEINPGNLLPDFIDGMYSDKNGFLWVGYRGSGIRKYQAEGLRLILVKEFSAAAGFGDLRIRCAYPDQKGNIIFGTRTNGIFIFSTTIEGKYWHFNTKNGLSANWVKSVSMDEYQRLYLATNNGITVISGNYEQPQINKVNFDDNNIPAETNFVFYDNQKLWVGMNGLLNYDVTEDHANEKTTPAVFLTQISINGQPDSSFVPYSKLMKTLHLQHEQDIIAFEFAGIYLTGDHDLQYRYMLSGQDKNWSPPTRRNNVSYNLRPGHYVFRVQAKTGNGAWSKEPAILSFIIAKPFWQSDWFIVVCTLIVAALLYALYRYRLQQVIRLERLRSRISTDLHDDIGSTLSSITILSDMTLREQNKKQSADMVQEIKTSSLSLMEKMDDIVWSINPKNDSLEHLMLRIRRFASTLFEAKDIDYVIEIEDSIKQVKLSMEYRQHIYLVLKEAINNLVKYSECTRASLIVKFENDYLKVTVSDNGRGFNQQTATHGNGIMSMNQRAQTMKGDLLISSAEKQGTIVFLKVKIK